MIFWKDFRKDENNTNMYSGELAQMVERALRIMRTARSTV